MPQNKPLSDEQFDDAQTEDLYPNDGYYFQTEEPQEQRAERAVERAKTKSALPLIKDLMIRYQNRMAYYDSIQAIPLEERKSDGKTNVKLMITLQANQQTKLNIAEEVEYLRQLLQTYAD